MFEARMEDAESGAVSPSLQEKLRDLENQRARTILDHVRQLKGRLTSRAFKGWMSLFVRLGPCLKNSTLRFKVTHGLCQGNRFKRWQLTSQATQGGAAKTGG
jgi:hypothetical protein